MNEESINQFEKTQSQLSGLYVEISLLSKKNPNEAVNKFKLKFINKILIESNELLGDDYLPFIEFERFNEDDLPTTSDVTMILQQYLNCLEKLRSDNLEYRSGEYYWVIDGQISDMKTAHPFKFKR